MKPDSTKIVIINGGIRYSKALNVFVDKTYSKFIITDCYGLNFTNGHFMKVYLSQVCKNNTWTCRNLRKNDGKRASDEKPTFLKIFLLLYPRR